MEDKLEALSQIPLEFLPPEVRSVLTGFLIGGIQGGMDAAAIIGIDRLPEQLRGIANDLLDGINWVEVPKIISDAVGSFFSNAGEGLSSFLSKIAGGIDLSNLNISGVFDKIFSGGFGDVTQFLSDLGSLPFLSDLLPGTGILNTVSTVLGVFDGGIGEVFNNLFKDGGFGLTSILSTFGVSSTLTGLIGPLFNLFGIGNANSKCPCDPSCRKTDHFVTEEGEELLDKCSSILANSSSTYLPEGDKVTANNNNPISDILGLVRTGLGEKLIPSNILNLTEFILGVPRLGEMASRVEGARNADFPDWQNELIYTFKAIENGFKVNDNNVTKIEEIIGLFLQANLFSQFFNKVKDDYVFEALGDLSLAVKDLQSQTSRLDAAKIGQYAGAIPQPPTQKAMAHIGRTVPYAAKTALDWKDILELLMLALRIWNSLKPGNDPNMEDATRNPDEIENEDIRGRNYFNFPSVNIAFEDEQLLDKYSDEEYYEERRLIFAGLPTPVFDRPEFERTILEPTVSDFAGVPIPLFDRRDSPPLSLESRSLEELRLNYPQWDDIVFNKYTSPGLLENVLIDGESPPFTLPEAFQSSNNPKIKSEDFVNALRNIYSQYEQERSSQDKTYC